MCWAGRVLAFSLFLVSILWTGCQDVSRDHVIYVGDRGFISRDAFDFAFQQSRDKDPTVTREDVLENLSELAIRSVLFNQAGMDTAVSFRDVTRRAERDLVTNLVREEKFIRPYLSAQVTQTFRSHLLQTVEVVLLVKKYDPDLPATRDTARAAIERLSRITTSRNFESMVRQHSDDRDLRSGLGSLLPHYILYGASGYNVESTIFSLHEGMLTPPLEVPGAFLMAKVVGRRSVPTFSDYKPPTNAELIQDLRERFLRENVDKLQPKEAEFANDLMATTPVLKDGSAIDVLTAIVLNKDSSQTNDHRVVATVDSRPLTIRDFLQDHENASFLHEDHVRNTVDRWILRYVVYISQEKRIRRSPEYSISWLSFMASQYDSWISQRITAPDDGILDAYYRRHAYRYYDPARVTLHELYVTTKNGRDSVQARLMKGYQLVRIAQELKRMAELNYVSNREITEQDGSRVFRQAMEMQPTEIRMVALGQDRYSFIQLVSKKDRRPLSYDEAASRVRSDWTSEQRRLDFLKAKARLAVQYPIVIHDVE